METSMEQTFLRIYDEFANRVFRHCYFRVSNREKAKDITQETFKRIWEYFSSSGVMLQNEKAFVFRIANNLIIDSYRKKKEDSLDVLQEAGFDIGFDERESIMNMISHQEIIKLLDELDPKYKDAIVMRYIDDMSVKDMASVAGVSENVISVRIHRGLLKIKDIIKSHA